MLEEKQYNDVIDSLRLCLEGATDMVNAEVVPYYDYFTTTGKWDGRKQNGFSVTIIVSHFYLSPIRMSTILADTFKRITEWMTSLQEDVYFSVGHINPISGRDARFEFKVYFDSVEDSAKRLLLR